NQEITAGAAAHNDLVVVGTRGGRVYGLNIATKQIQWNTAVGNEVLAAPAIGSNVVVVKTIDGKVTGLSAEDGHHLWSHQEVEPNLILRTASTPQITQDSVVIGYASGKVIKLSLLTGDVQWTQTIATPEGAFAIQRMIDIDANPVVMGNRVYVATYQGKIAALNLADGNIQWDHDISAYSGIAVDEHHVYVSDAKSDIWAFNRETGQVAWKQTKLEYRNTTGPATIGNNIVVGDAQGALHWLNKQDGSFAGRAQLGGKGIYANPIAQNGIVYVLTQDGYLVAYRG
ncbi:MAG TPA: outer membrane protein assembly factor BamB, partial [Gammaproteobacteria bacterium]|nr:outer membrane protein assembly factor BamB [Gammaproteobacteria bacterium]